MSLMIDMSSTSGPECAFVVGEHYSLDSSSIASVAALVSVPVVLVAHLYGT
jgi:hypothetical protein